MLPEPSVTLAPEPEDATPLRVRGLGTRKMRRVGVGMLGGMGYRSGGGGGGGVFGGGSGLAL